MPQITPDQIDGLTAAINSHDYLDQILHEIERLHRVVFHGNKRVDWQLVQRSAQQILIVEIVSRYHGRIEGMHDTLCAMEASGTPWDVALRELATSIHSYYTTPLGIVMRQDMFGDQAIFIAPDAYTWTDRPKGSQESSRGQAP